jgi:DNA-binding transcriptional MocR family regulator
MGTGDDDLHRYATRAARMGASEIRELLKLLDQPDIISFAGGIPNPALFPADELAGAFGAAISGGAAAALQYSVSEGYAPLRQWIVDRMGQLGVPCGLDNVVITSGSQQALDFIGKLTLSPGDTALVTAPTYLGALQAFNAYEPRYDTLEPESDDSTAQGYTDAARAAGSRIGLAYVVPDFANPTGETLSLGARERLLRLSRELDVLLVEDAAYTDLRFAGEPLPSLAALAARDGGIEESNVLHCGTFSKTVAPGLRVGWVCGPSDVVRRLVLVKQASDLHSSSVNQIAMHTVIEQVWDDQVARVQAAYRERRDVMLGALERSMPGNVMWREPDGGMFVWLRLEEGLDGARLLERALAEERVAFVPGGAFFADRSGASTIRLSYSLPPLDRMEEGIARLGRLLARA